MTVHNIRIIEIENPTEEKACKIECDIQLGFWNKAYSETVSLKQLKNIQEKFSYLMDIIPKIEEKIKKT